MIAAILIGRKESKGFPGKNTAMIFGRPLFAYPLRAAAAVKQISRIVVSSDDPSIKTYIEQRTKPPYRGTPIQYMERPSYLCTDEAQAGEVYQYVYKELRFHDTTTVRFEFLVLLMANAPMVSPELINQGLDMLRSRQDLDSAITVSKMNMYNPSRARQLDDKGLLQPMARFPLATCDRDSLGDTYFADFGACVVRPTCLEKLDGLPPQSWMGNRIYPLVQDWPGFDMDYAWQLPQVEQWLHRHGYTELA